MKKSFIVQKALKNWKAGKYDDCGICRCLSDTQHDLIGHCYKPYDWYAEIGNIILGYAFVNGWLRQQGIDPGKIDMHLYREQWLEHLYNYYLSVGE